MILLILILLLYATYTDIKTLEVPLWVSPVIIGIRFLQDFMSEENNFRIMSGLLCGAILFGIFFMVAYLGDQLGGADCLIVAAIGYSLDFYGFYAVIIGLALTLPYTAYMKIAKKRTCLSISPFFNCWIHYYINHSNNSGPAYIMALIRRNYYVTKKLECCYVNMR